VPDGAPVSNSSPGLAAKRVELVHGHLDVYASTLAVMSELDDAAWDRQSGCPGWSVHDLLSHMIGLERLMLGDEFPDHVVDPMPPHVSGPVAEKTEVDVDLRRGRSRADLLAEARETFDRRAAALSALAPEDMDQPMNGVFGTDVAVKVLGIRLFDLYAHEQDIRRASRQLGHQQGPAAEVFWRRSSRGMAASLGQRVEATGNVTFVIDEPEPRHVTINLGDDGPGAALTLDWSTWVALVCGRADAPRDRVTIDGEDDLATKVLGAMNLTI
jgi:uncharacterized protein (TIGR03083 family)